MAIRSAGTTNVVSELWWLTLMQSVLAIFFGIAAIFWPGLTLITLVYLFSAFVLVWGIIEIVHALMSIGRRDTWWLTMIFGLLGLIVGVYLVRHPNVSFATFILLIGATLIVRGLFDVIGTFLDRRSATHRILMLIIGIAAVIAGIIVVMQPAVGGIAFVWVLGLYALVFGIVTFTIAIEARKELNE
jgi:uncharacterized membrane protein HdeD (DUF308 family)